MLMQPSLLFSHSESLEVQKSLKKLLNPKEIMISPNQTMEA